MKYDKYSYLFPPRPTETTKYTELGKYDNGEFLVQPKYNGTCCMVFMNENELIVMNRHKGLITSNYSDVDFRGLHRGKGWLVLCGEFLNKNKKGEKDISFNLKFVIWDILVYQNDYMIGSTFKERMNLLDELYPSSKMVVGKELESYIHLLITRQKNVYKAPYYESGFLNLYQSIVKTDLYEGLVLKRKNAKLSLGLTEKNNNTWQIKCRKPTKLYAF